MLNSLAVCFCSTLWSIISNTLKRLGFQSHNFLAQLLSETSRACTIRVRRSTLGGLWNDLVWFIKTKRRRVSMLEAFSWTAALCMAWSSNRSEHPGNEKESLSAKIQA